MNPYRLALTTTRASTCFDPPPSPCADDARVSAPRRMHFLVAASFGASLAVGAFALHAVGHGGHIEIAPTAISHAAHAKKKKDKPHVALPAKNATASPPAQARRELTTPEQAWLVGVHDQKTLVMHARELAALGLDVSVVEVQLSNDLATWSSTHVNAFPVDLVPLRSATSNVDALSIHNMPENSPLRIAGIENGDELLGINGFRFDSDTLRYDDVLGIRSQGWLVAEIARSRHHIVLSIHWKATHPSPAR